jgi:hypothetical protein
LRARRVAWLVAIAVSVASPATTTLASPLLDLAGDSGGTAGLQARAVPGGSGATYFNPALLVDSKAELTLGFFVLAEQIAMTLDGRPGTQFAVPTGLENAGHADTSRWDNYPVATEILQNGRKKDATHDYLAPRPRQGAGTGHDFQTYELIGFVAKLFHDRAAFGFHGLIPNGDFTTLHAFYNDEREQYFSNSLHPELYSDRMTAVSMAFGGAVRVIDRLSLGAGATMSLRALVNAPTYVVDTGRLQDILIDTDAKVKVSLSPHFGVAYTPMPRLRLTGTLHAPEKVEMRIGFTFLLANGVEQASSITFLHDYTPWQLGLGAAYDLVKTADTTFTVSGTLVYATWSDYRDRHDAAPTPAYAWSDTLAPSGGVRYTYKDVATFLDVIFQPTPVPPQTGRTNYVDDDRLGASLGSDVRFTLWGTDVRVGAQLQGHWLLYRHQTKLPTPTSPDGRNHTPELVKDEVPDDAQISGEPVAGVKGLQTNNPGWPGFGSTGVVLGGGVHLAVSL